MTSPGHWAYHVAKAPRKAAERRLHAVERIEALTLGEAPAFGSETIEDRLAEVDGLTVALDADDRCRRCGKKLDQPHTKRRHYGDDCWAIELAAGRVTADGAGS